MARRWFHYDAAFEQFLRRHTLPYIAVDEAKRALGRDPSSAEASSLKSFDFVVYSPAPGSTPSDAEPPSGLSLRGEDFRAGFGREDPAPKGPVSQAGGTNLLVDVKGRRHEGRGRRGLQNWVTRADVEGLARWQRLFGPGFEAAFAFLYWYPTPPETPPPEAKTSETPLPGDPWFPECFTVQGRWYALRVVRLTDYQRAMKPRSPKWGTVDLPAAAFADLACALGDLLGVSCAAA